MVSTAAPAPSQSARAALRRRLQEARDAFAAGPDVAAASDSLALHLSELLARLEPTCLGLYWSIRAEFNAAAACLADPGLNDIQFALPCARRSPVAMDYRRWDRRAPTVRDECGLPTAQGAVVVPDVVLVPCLGYTRSGYRLGYGGGYFDRWLAAHPQATAVGIGWGPTEIGDDELAPQPHDRPLMILVRHNEVLTGN